MKFLFFAQELVEKFLFSSGWSGLGSNYVKK